MSTPPSSGAMLHSGIIKTEQDLGDTDRRVSDLVQAFEERRTSNSTAERNVMSSPSERRESTENQSSPSQRRGSTEIQSPPSERRESTKVPSPAASDKRLAEKTISSGHKSPEKNLSSSEEERKAVPLFEIIPMTKLSPERNSLSSPEKGGVLAVPGSSSPPSTLFEIPIARQAPEELFHKTEPEVPEDEARRRIQPLPITVTDEAKQDIQLSESKKKRKNRTLSTAFRIIQATTSCLLAILAVSVIVLALYWQIQYNPIEWIRPITTNLIYMASGGMLAAIGGMLALPRMHGRTRLLIFSGLVVIVIVLQMFCTLSIRKHLLIDPNTVSQQWTTLSTSTQNAIQDALHCCGWSKTSTDCKYTESCLKALPRWQLEADDILIEYLLFSLIGETILLGALLGRVFLVASDEK